MKKIIVTSLFILICNFFVGAQDYRWGLGIRAGMGNGTSGGVTCKYFTDERTAFEGILSWRWQGYVFTGLYEWHGALGRTHGNLKWYWGFGAHFGTWKGSTNHPWFNTSGTHTVIGVDGTLGVEYTFHHFPAVIGCDWRPNYNIFGYEGFDHEFSIFIRFPFKWYGR